MGHWIFITLLGFFAIKGTSGVGPAIRNCDSHEIIKCLQSTQSEGQLFFPDTQQKLREYCRHLMSGLDCARSVIDHCYSQDDQETYYNLTKDMVGMNVALCTPGSTFSMRFLKHVDCYKSLSDRFQSCSDRYISNILVVRSLTQAEQMGMSCCTVREYNRCMRNAVESRCNEDAEKLLEETVETSLKQFVGHCKTLGDFPTSNCMKRYSPGNSHETSNLNDENGAGRSTIAFGYWILLCLLVLSMS